MINLIIILLKILRLQFDQNLFSQSQRINIQDYNIIMGKKRIAQTPIINKYLCSQNWPETVSQKKKEFRKRIFNRIIDKDIRIITVRKRIIPIEIEEIVIEADEKFVPFEECKHLTPFGRDVKFFCDGCGTGIEKLKGCSSIKCSVCKKDTTCLPIKYFQPTASYFPQRIYNIQGNCQICELKLSKGVVAISTCGHIYHFKCIDKKTDRCPQCKKTYLLANKVDESQSSSQSSSSDSDSSRSRSHH